MSSTFGYTDEPITKADDDALGIKEHVGALADFIKQCQTPITISIQGDWGSGKTSMMRMIQEQINGNVESIWFNTWQFSQFDMQDNIAVSLLSSFLDDLGEAGQPARSTLTKIGTMVLGGLGHLAKTGVDLAVGAGGDLLKAAVDKLQFGSEDLDPVRQIKNIKSEIQKAVDARLLSQKADRLVVFIDDLDRLLPEKAVELLETLKLFLDIKQCVFVLAVDYQVVAKGLQKKFNVSMDDLKGRSFFDKIIQVPYNLPVSQYNTQNYLKKLFGNTFGEASEDLEIFQRLAAHSLGVNPRGMKRLFNTLQLLRMVAQAKNMLTDEPGVTLPEKLRVLFAVLCLQTSYPSVYEVLLKQQDKLNKEFLHDFHSVEDLKKHDELYRDITKGLKKQGEAEPDPEHLQKLTRFMETLFDAIQLRSDQGENANETLLPQELDNLRRFLSFSSLTSSSGEGTVGNDAQFRYQNLLNNWIVNDFNPKFGEQLAAMGSKLEYWARTDQFKVYFWFHLGNGFGFALVCLMTLGENRISIHLDDDENPRYSTPTRRQVVNWFQRNTKEIFPEQKPSSRIDRRWNFYTLQENNLDNSTIESKLDKFKEITDEVLTGLISLLAKFAETKKQAVEKAIGFKRNLEKRLKDVFPDKDGWICEPNPYVRSMDAGGGWYIYQDKWKDHVKIYIALSDNFLHGMMFGLLRTQWKQNYKDGQEELVKKNLSEQFSKRESGWVPEGNWIWRVFAKYKDITLGQIVDDDFHYALDNEAEEQAALERLMNDLAKLKEQTPLIESLFS